MAKKRRSWFFGKDRTEDIVKTAENYGAPEVAKMVTQKAKSEPVKKPEPQARPADPNVPVEQLGDVAKGALEAERMRKEAIRLMREKTKLKGK
jgi:hypothetical protein